MKIFIGLLLFFSVSSYANVGDFFASSASTLAMAGQSNFNANDASNNQYVPAILAQSDKTSYSFNIFAIHTDFKKIEDIVVNSPINSAQTSDELGNVDTDYPNQYIMAIHGSFNLFKRLSTKLNLSAYMPTEKMLETSTGDPYRPEYVMYRTRFLRTIFLANIAHKFDNYAISIGGMSGFQSTGETYVVARQQGSGDPPSSGKMSFNARPSMALTFSFYKELSFGKMYFSFQDEMKNKLFNNASGYTPIGASSLKYDWDLSSMLYYDPRIYRLGMHSEYQSFHLFYALEYQDWSGYEAPILNMENNGGILSSSNTQENFKTQNIFVPKIGIEIKRELNTYTAGLSYRISPLKLTSGASGNSIDCDSTILALGHSRQFHFFEQDFNFHSGLQYHLLKDTTVTKDVNREDGTSGTKIGGPDYQIGGSVFAVSFGLSWVI